MDCKKNHFNPTLAILFCSIENDLGRLVKLFNSQEIDLFGCTSAGEIINESVQGTSIVGLLLDLPKDSFKVNFSCDSSKTTYDLAVKCGKETASTFDNPALLVVSGGVAINAENIVFGLKDDFQILQILTGDNVAYKIRELQLIEKY